MALLKKRFLTFRRDKKMWIFVVLMPLLFVGVGTLIILGFEQDDQPSLTLSPKVRVRRIQSRRLFHVVSTAVGPPRGTLGGTLCEIPCLWLGVCRCETASEQSD